MKNRKLESGASPTLGLDPSVSVGSEEEEEESLSLRGFYRRAPMDRGERRGGTRAIASHTLGTFL